MSRGKRLRPAAERLLDWVYPPSCPGCGRDGYGFCAACRQSLQTQHRRFGEAVDVYAAGLYERELRRALLQMKMDGYTYLSYALADLMAAALPPHLSEIPAAAVPMPPSPQRLRRRGYHCPFLLAKAVARRIDTLTYRPDLLSLTRSLGEQKKLSRTERFANVKDAYRAGAADGLYILLIDDVLTTGASVNEAARSLYGRGALKVDALVLAVRD